MSSNTLVPTSMHPIGAESTLSSSKASTTTLQLPKKVLCTCAAKCGTTPGKLVAPSTRSGHRKRERERLAAHIHESSRTKDVVVENLHPSTPETAQPPAPQLPKTMLTTSSAPGPATSSKFLAVPPIPNNITTTSSTPFKKQKASTSSALASSGGAGATSNASTTVAGGLQVGSGASAGGADTAAASASSSPSRIATRPLTEMHMRNPAQIISSAAASAAAGTRHTTFTSFIPPAQPALQQTVSVAPPPLFGSSMGMGTTQANYSFTNAGASAGNPSFTVPGTHFHPSNTTTTPSGPLPPFSTLSSFVSTSGNERIEAWARDTARLATLQEEAELENIRACLFEARQKYDDLQKQNLHEREVLELEMQRMESENKSLRAQVTIRSHALSSIQCFAKMYGREALPPSLRALLEAPPQDAALYYENFHTKVINTELLVTEQYLRGGNTASIPTTAPVQKPLAPSKRTGSSYAGGTLHSPIKSEMSDSDETLLEPSPPLSRISTNSSMSTSNMSHRGHYQSLRAQPDKRRRYNPLS